MPLYQQQLFFNPGTKQPVVFRVNGNARTTVWSLPSDRLWAGDGRIGEQKRDAEEIDAPGGFDGVGGVLEEL